jgi:hypothetical protein
MVDPMVDLEKLQETLLTFLKSQSAIIALLGDADHPADKEVREHDWMSRNFAYNNIRLRMLQMGPRPDDNGECRPLISNVSFSVVCFGADASSRPCLRIMQAVHSEMNNKKLPDTAFIRFVSRIEVPPNGLIFPVPDGERVWRGEVQARVTVKEPGGLGA